MRKKLIQTILLFSVALSSIAQTTNPNFFEFAGKESVISELPIIKGRWLNPENRAANQFRIENGVLYSWSTNKCGEDQRPITKAYKDGAVYSLEFGNTKFPLRCPTIEGGFYKFDTNAKTGIYHIKANKDTLEILRSGTLELN